MIVYEKLPTGVRVRVRRLVWRRVEARLYTSCGVFTVNDDTFRAHWDSADTYAGLHEGWTYDLDTAGFRVPILSKFPNMLDAREVEW